MIEAEEQMNEAEELMLFHHEMGRAFDAWADIEIALSLVVKTCVSGKDAQMLVIGLYAIDNFRNKLSYCNSLLAEKHASAPAFIDWPELNERLLRLAKMRNQLAHGFTMLIPDAPVGSRVGIVNPKHYESPTSWRSDTREKRLPQNSMTLLDIAKAYGDFRAGHIALINFYFRLCGQVDKHPKSDELEQSRPAIREVRNRIRAALSLPPIPSRK